MPVRKIRNYESERNSLCLGWSAGGGKRRGRIVPVQQLIPCFFFLRCTIARFPSETIWQRLHVMAELGAVQVVSYLGCPPRVIDPPNGVRLINLTNGGPLSRLAFPSRVRSLARRLRGEIQKGLIWTTPDYLTRRAARAAAAETGWPVVMDVWDVPDLSARNQWREGNYLKALAHRSDATLTRLRSQNG